MPVFRSRVQAELLTALLMHPDEERTLTELARHAGVALSTARAEVSRLVSAGIFTGRTVGRTRPFRANVDNPPCGHSPSWSRSASDRSW